MIIGDIETSEKVEYEDLLKNYYEKMEIIEEQDKEIERLNNGCEELEQQIDDLYKLETTLTNENEKLHSIIKEVREYCNEVIKEHENGEYNVSTTQLAIEEHKKNIISLLNILNGDLENYWRSDKE